MKPLPERRITDAVGDRLTSEITALIVDDESSYRAYITDIAERVGFAVAAVFDGPSALEMLSNSAFDVLIVNLDSPGTDGLQRIAPKETYSILLTSQDDVDKKIAALEAGYDDFLSKSATELEVVAKLVAARRVITRQQTVNHLVRDLYGMASHDELTGVFNRRFLFAETEKVLGSGTAATLVLFDLDDFKKVNDTFGHVVGDRVLRDVGALFQRATRPDDLVGRYGGDEFIMVVTGSPFYLVETIADRLSSDIRELTWTIGNDEFSVGVSVGIASSHFLTDATLTQLLEAADRDLYKNKWVRKHPEEARSSGRLDHVLPLPMAVSELSTIRTSRRSNEISPLPGGDRTQRPGARRHHADD
jgi:two-component system cell cycle response regulator